MKESIAHIKAKAFAVRIVKFVRYLEREKHEFTLSKQILRSGTSIGANAKEGAFAQSKADLCARLFVAQKECAETEYWLELLYESNYINQKEFDSIYEDCQELLRLIVASTKTLQGKN